MAQKTWVFIIPAFFENRPQAIRFKKLLSYHNNEEIKIIVITNEKDVKEFLFEEKLNVTIRTYPSSKFGSYINQFYYPKNLYQYSKFLEILRPYVRAVFKRVLFPDMFTIEYYRILNSVIEIQKNHVIDGLLISSSPHSLLKTSKTFKSIDFRIDKVLYDIGDPLYNNSSKKNRPIFNILAKKYERKYLKYIDTLIVTNKETKQHFQKLYATSPISTKVRLLPMGGEIPEQDTTSFLIPAKDCYTIMYAGIFYKKLRSPQPFFNALIQLNKKKSPKFELDIYGNGMNYYKKNLPKELTNYVKFHEVVDNKHIQELYGKYDFLLHIDNAFGLQTPGKNFELYLSNKPIIFLYEFESSSYNLFYSKPGVISARNDSKSIVKKLSTIKGLKWSSRVDESVEEYTWNSRYNQLLNILELL